MKKRSAGQYAKILYAATHDMKGADLKNVIKNFVKFLGKERVTGKLENIIKEFIKRAKLEEGIVSLEVESAKKLDHATLEKIKRSFGKETEAETKVNPELLGGIKVRAGDKIFDSSVKTQILKLKQKLF